MPGDVQSLRRQLHAIAEVGLHLRETQRLLLQELSGLPVRIDLGVGLSSVAVVIEGSTPGPTVLLRADMDALPVTEQTDLDFASTNGAMHACGHDLHMAALVGAVRLLCERRDEFAGTVLAVFQPGEEGHGGAERMLAAGVLDTTGLRPIASYSMHVFSFLERGVFFCRPGVVMGSTVNFTLTVDGVGGHAARPFMARNPVLVGALIVQAIQSHVTQTMSSADPIVATVGSFQAGDAPNVITERALLGISIRALTEERVRSVLAQIHSIADGLAHGFGMTVSIDEGPLMPPTVSDADAAALVETVVTDIVGADRFRPLAHPEMIAEDFSLFLEATGGAFLFVGASTGDQHPAANHSARATFDDSVVPDAARVLAELAIRRLAEAPSTPRTERAS